MKKIIAAVFLFSIAAWAAGPFDGTWKVDLKKAKLSTEADTFLFQNGRFQCPTCTPKIDIKADGTDQPQAGSPYFDTIAVKIVDDRTIDFTRKKDGKVVAKGRRTLRPDGQVMLVDATTYPSASAQAVTNKSKLVRVAAGPSGAHACSGSWRQEDAEISDNGLTATLKSIDNGFALTTPTGEAFEAKFDGKDYAYKGNPGVSHVSLRRIDQNTFEEVDKKDGKIVGVVRWKANTDGKTMDITYEDKLRGRTETYVMVKQ